MHAFRLNDGGREYRNAASLLAVLFQLAIPLQILVGSGHVHALSLATNRLEKVNTNNNFFMQDSGNSNGNTVQSSNGIKHAQQHQQQQQQPKNVKSFDAFVQMRSGLRPDEPKDVYSDVVFWTADGELYESPSGTMIARIEGLETSRAVRLDDNVVRIFSRKLVWFLHPETYEIMTEFEGQAVNPIRYDAQVFDMKRGKATTRQQPMEQQQRDIKDNDPDGDVLAPILPFVVRSTRLVPCMPITPRWGGTTDVLMFQVPLFIDIEIPLPPAPTAGAGVMSKLNGETTRRYQAWEFYDYFLDLHSETTPVLSWMRQGSTPPFCTDGNGVMHARGHRVGSFEELPPTTQEYVNKNYPLFHGPPTGMEEVDELLGPDIES